MGSSIVRNAPALDPNVIHTSSNESLINKMKTLILHIIKLRWIDAQCGDEVISQYRLFLENDVKQYHERFTNFKREDGCLDEFFFSTCEVDKNYKELSSVIEIILTLSHGQAAVERNFSLRKSFVVDNISETSVINKKLIKDHMFANKLTAATIHITREMHAD